MKHMMVPLGKIHIMMILFLFMKVKRQTDEFYYETNTFLSWNDIELTTFYVPYHMRNFEKETFILVSFFININEYNLTDNF